MTPGTQHHIVISFKFKIKEILYSKLNKMEFFFFSSLVNVLGNHIEFIDMTSDIMEFYSLVRGGC